MDIPWNPAILEQRIGRVHRLGQSRPVRVINFVTSSSIEEHILELLKFKRSLFAGALDEGGEDTVMIGKSQLKRFMKIVEETTAKIEKPDPEVEKQKEMEEKQDMLTSSPQNKTDPKKKETQNIHQTGSSTDSLSNLLQMGAQFLMDINKSLSQADNAGVKSFGKQIDGMIDKDKNTGETFIKLPVPNPETLQTLIKTCGKLVSAYSSNTKD